MKNYIIILLILISDFCFANEAKTRYSLVRNQYSIDTANKSFTNKITINGILYESTHKAVLYYGELEKIENIVPEVYTNNKYKRISKSNIFDSDVFTSSFYSGYKTKSIQYSKPEKLESINFRLSASVINKELMCLSNLLFYQEDDYEVDTIEHIIEIPLEYKLLINFNDIKNKYNIRVDSVRLENSLIYTFRKIYPKLYILKNKNLELKQEKEIISIRIIVLPRNEEPFQYFNSWYQNLISSIPLSNEYKIICDSISQKYNNKDSVIKYIFQYVNIKIRYIDIENGINAFKPRSTAEILFKKQGDCKDMAYLLYTMFNYLGFDATIGINSTIDHIHQFDFPTLSSGNHAICVLKYNNKNYYLDATERLCFYNKPSRQIQKTKVFLSKPNKYSLLEIPSQEPKFSTSNLVYNLNVNENNINGTFKNEYFGFSKLMIDNVISSNSLKNSNQILRKYFQDNNFNIEYRDLDTKLSDSNTIVQGSIKLNSTIVNNINEKTYFHFNFCPNILPTKTALDTTTTKDYYFYYSSLKSSRVIINFPNPIKKFESMYENYNYRNEEYSYTFKITKDKNKLIIDYTFINFDNSIKSDKIKEYNEIFNNVNKTLNHEIIIY